MPPLIGDPTKLLGKPPRQGMPTNLLEHVRTHRSFLATGPGGLPRAAIRHVVQTAFHMALLLGFVYLLVWPLGLLLHSWAVEGLEIGPARGKVEFAIGPQQWIPPLVWAIVAAIPMVLWLFTRPGRARTMLTLAIAGLASLSIGCAFVLIALPWLVANVNLFPDRAGRQLTTTGIYATLVAGVWQLAKRYLQRQAKYLGGVLLAIGVGLFALRVIEEVVLETSWLGRAQTYPLVFALMLTAFVFANPDKWSLSDFYRKRLAGTFVTQLDERFHPTPLAEDRAPRLFEYIDAPGPAPIVCCAASRQEETETGVAALSMTFEPATVTVHGWRDNHDHAEPTEQSMSHVEFRRRLPQGRQGDRLSSLIGAAAISGAAVAPSMGRLNLKTTNALLAAFNARLGPPRAAPRSAW